MPLRRSAGLCIAHIRKGALERCAVLGGLATGRRYGRFMCGGGDGNEAMKYRENVECRSC